MKARLIINEIKHRIKYSGLGSIGVGKVTVLDPIIDMLKANDGKKFYITFSWDKREPDSEETFVLDFERNNDYCILNVTGYSIDEYKVYIKINFLTRTIKYKVGDDVITYKNSDEFLKIFSSTEVIFKSLKEETQNLLVSDGAILSEYHNDIYKNINY